MTRDRKILTSRVEGNDFVLDRLQDFVFLVWDVLERDSDPDLDMPKTVEECLQALDDGLTEMAMKHLDQKEEIHQLGSDVLNLSVSNAALISDLRKVEDVVQGLTNPVNVAQVKNLDNAVNIFLRESEADMVAKADGAAVNVEVRIKSDEQLRAGLMQAVEYFNCELADQLLR